MYRLIKMTVFIIFFQIKLTKLDYINSDSWNRVIVLLLILVFLALFFFFLGLIKKLEAV